MLMEREEGGLLPDIKNEDKDVSREDRHSECCELVTLYLYLFFNVLCHFQAPWR